MPLAPRIQQDPTTVVSLEGWRLDDEFPYGPQGAKPKRIVICPNPPPHAFLIGGHRYLFKEPSGSRAQQVWSEVIAYEVARDLGIPVPPAFLALGPANGSPGVLVEFFYGYQYEPEYRFVHAIERLQGPHAQVGRQAQRRVHPFEPQYGPARQRQRSCPASIFQPRAPWLRRGGGRRCQQRRARPIGDRGWANRPGVAAPGCRRHPFALAYGATLEAPVYSELLDLAGAAMAELSDLGSRDMIDVQSFIWIVGAYPG